MVDLLHNNASVLLYTLLFARYVAEFYGLEVAAYIAPTFVGDPVPIEEVAQLARSFGVKSIANMNEQLNDGVIALRLIRSLSRDLRASMTCRRLKKLTGARLRREILGLRIAGVDVGGLIYDSYLRSTGSATIEEYNDELGNTVADAYRIYHEFERILSNSKARAVVVTQGVYIEYMIPLRLSLKRGVTGFVKYWLDPICVRRYNDVDESVESAAMPVRPALEYFRGRLGGKLAERADEFFPPAPAKTQATDYFQLAYSSEKMQYTKQQLFDLLDIDPRKRNCLIMAHQFTDCPHDYPHILFDDYFQWLDETLAFAASNGQINWLVREHPYEVALKKTADFETLIRRYAGGRSHIKVVPNNATTSSLFSCVDAVTTVNGSGGLEFAAAGVPCVLAGNPFYADFDFAIKPGTKEAYFVALADIPKLGRLSERQVTEAKQLALVYARYRRVSSNRVPFISDLGGREVSQNEIDKYWVDATHSLNAARLEDDPLYKNVRRMLHENYATLLDFDIC